MTPSIETSGAAIVFNGQAGRDYTPAMEAILSDATFQAARSAITSWPGYAPTPLVFMPKLAHALGVGSIAYKDESGRFGLGSFKALGGAYAVMRLLMKRIADETGQTPEMADLFEGRFSEIADTLTVTCATDGNHGRSVAWGAKLFGCRCVIFIHKDVSEGRKAAIEAFGARVVRSAGNYDDSVREAQETATREGWFVVSDTSYPGYRDVPANVMQGYEMMAFEALAQMDDLPTHLILQTGVGGMAAAVAAHVWRRTAPHRPKVILADPEAAACWYETIAAGHPVTVGGDLDTLMAGLACGEVSELAYDILKTGADVVVRLPDRAAIDAMKVLAEGACGDKPVVAGESAVAGIAALAALMEDTEAAARLELGPRSRVLVFGTEGDTDPAVYARLAGRTGDEVRAAATAWEKRQ
ncbi:diaminopropionate ammonia-lyase [Hartmannibacter diazotrophicus]|uniref:Diaminopropionate ammonia-lyase n=1 Tax=Hartmannibacter diazotrophicus TaxID=1482074 RepID=A0A2C9DB54_9HYPH|nr:diaminopropionate ammonia-lyase [Hartmannibacter diazotrophicus]SON57527.1 diaminopropionate ammonia-lyase [Hartmannibacter diazotrophicus]